LCLTVRDAPRKMPCIESVLPVSVAVLYLKWQSVGYTRFPLLSCLLEILRMNLLKPRFDGVATILEKLFPSRICKGDDPRGIHHPNQLRNRIGQSTEPSLAFE